MDHKPPVRILIMPRCATYVNLCLPYEDVLSGLGSSKFGWMGM
jgi:hypothetical protein